MAAELVIESNGDRPRHYRLPGPVLVIGSAPGCDLVLPGLFVSRRHARLELLADGWSLVDLDSKNGVRLNGQRMTASEPALLRDRDKFELPGYAFTFWTPDAAGTTRELDTGEAIAMGRRLDVDIERHAVSIDGRRLSLQFSPTEFRLLSVLAACGGRVLSRAELLGAVWGIHPDGTPKADDSMLYGLLHAVRARLADAGHADLIQNVRGVGYTVPTQQDAAHGTQ